MVKIIFTDVDGTLFNSASKLCEPNKAACLKAQSLGVPVVINTGRHGSNAKEVAKLIHADQFHGYAIGNDGAEIWSFKDNKWIYLQQLTKITAHQLYKWLISYSDDLILNFNCIDTLYINALYHRWSDWFQELGIKITKINHFSDINEEVSKVMVILERYWAIDKINQFIADFEQQFPDLTIVHYHTNVFSIGCKNISKGSAIIWLCDYLNIKPQDAMGLGDSFNDLTMFEAVGHPVVMENSHQAIKTYSEWVSPNNNCSGVAHAIDHYLLKKSK